MNETLAEKDAVRTAVSAVDRLRISEVFYSLQGESDTVGWPTVFVRLTGCPLRCSYCDTAYAFQGGEWMSLENVMETVAGYQPYYVTVTGGEPLAQKSCLRLLKQLCDRGYQVSLETSGALDVSEVDPRVVKVMDLKSPSSGEGTRNRYANFEHLSPNDQVKIVIANRPDYEWAREQISRYKLPAICDVLLSPVHGQLSPGQLADWILEDRLPVRLQVQLHKYLWGDVQGR